MLSRVKYILVRWLKLLAQAAKLTAFSLRICLGQSMRKLIRNIQARIDKSIHLPHVDRPNTMAQLFEFRNTQLMLKEEQPPSLSKVSCSECICNGPSACKPTVNFYLNELKLMPIYSATKSNDNHLDPVQQLQVRPKRHFFHAKVYIGKANITIIIRGHNFLRMRI